MDRKDMAGDSGGSFVSRAGLKLAAALDAFGVSPASMTCADLGCNAGGFTDCLLQRGARRVYAIDTGYGMLDYRLRRDDRVVVMERTNALHARVPEPVDLVAIDVAWTPQRLILPAARVMLGGGGGGLMVTLVKPHYEAGPDELVRGKLPDEKCPGVLDRVEGELDSLGLRVDNRVRSPIVGTKASNPEWLWLVRARV